LKKIGKKKINDKKKKQSKEEVKLGNMAKKKKKIQ
jgi:hypothetical protein